LDVLIWIIGSAVYPFVQHKLPKYHLTINHYATPAGFLPNIRVKIAPEHLTSQPQIVDSFSDAEICLRELFIPNPSKKLSSSLSDINKDVFMTDTTDAVNPPLLVDIIPLSVPLSTAWSSISTTISNRSKELCHQTLLRNTKRDRTFLWHYSWCFTQQSKAIFYPFYEASFQEAGTGRESCVYINAHTG